MTCLRKALNPGLTSASICASRNSYRAASLAPGGRHVVAARIRNQLAQVLVQVSRGRDPEGAVRHRLAEHIERRFELRVRRLRHRLPEERERLLELRDDLIARHLLLFEGG